MGSVEKRGEYWRIRYSLPPDPDGKRRQKSEVCRGTKREAEALLRRRLMEHEPLPVIAVYRDGPEPEVILGFDPAIDGRAKVYDITRPGRWPSLSVREGKLPSDVQAVYYCDPDRGDELLVWNQDLTPEQRAGVLGIKPRPVWPFPREGGGGR